ncbi:MAG: peptide chain release factor N(5)-glutamine methyltransferase [Gammaproteobacteria bacterium]
MSAGPPTDVAARPAASVATSVLLAGAVRELAAASDTPRLDAELLLAFATGRSRSSLLAFPERTVPAFAANGFAGFLARRAQGEPVAYLTGTREFYSLTLTVNAAVLVPRPETELCVDAVLGRCTALRRPAVLDVGTGSGAIALAVKHACVHANVTGLDVSADALAVARVNAERLGLAVRWLESSWFAGVEGQRYDVIASNPPYVRSADVRGALAFEPRLALDGGGDGCDAYRMLFMAAKRHLNASGALVLEHGAEQRAELVALAESSGWRVAEMHDDLAGRARVLVLELERSTSI